MDKNFIKFMCTLVLLPVSVLFAQDEQTSKHRNLKLAFEFGTNVMSCELVKPEQIRESHYSYYYYKDEYYSDYGHIGDYCNLGTFNVGVKPELFFYNNRLGVASGLRIAYAKSELVSDRNNYLWRLRKDGLNTYYVQIKDIRQNNILLSIPLEVRFFPNNRELPFQHYFNMGASFNYRIYHDSKVTFTSKNMEKYREEVQNQLPASNGVFSVFMYGAIGFKIGRYKDGKVTPWGNIEFQFPYIMAVNNSFAFAGKDGFGVGFQMSFQIPIGKNVPMGTKND
jgi:hypothetical protein